ncbi:MAG: diaminopimelate epimerase [Bacteroidia bacterium]|nr:diaminopimelate epimerase [Bacteroidia bacterium]
MDLYFSKYQGTGNDFILLDGRAGVDARWTAPEQVALLCDRRFGIGADGLICLLPSQEADFRMQYFNSDGHESTMCGNGGRCLAAFAAAIGAAGAAGRFLAVDGPHAYRILPGGLVELEMIRPYGYRVLGEDRVFLHTGSPHYVAFLPEGLEQLAVDTEGRRIRYDAAFAPGGLNVNFVQADGPQALRVRTYERGVEAETLSCGTGVTAAAYTWLIRSGLAAGGQGSVQIRTPGGELAVRVSDFGAETERVLLTGPAERVFDGVYRSRDSEVPAQPPSTSASQISI